MTRPSVVASTLPTLTDPDYLRFRSLIEERFGLSFPEKRRVEMERGVWQAFAASACSNTDEYYNLLLDSDKSGIHLETLANALTICETHFFRDEAQFDALYFTVLPQIIERRRALRTLRVWSAGCASGEEPYSIAIMLRELIPDVDQWSITILGTDINSEALDRARQGLYSDWAFREERARLFRTRFFQQRGNRYALSHEIKRMVTFNYLNLAEDNYPSFGNNTTFMDLILCRNVTIYFSEALTHKIVDRLYDAQIDGGWLVVGHSEPSLVNYRRYKIRNFPNTVLYQREEQAIQAIPIFDPTHPLWQPGSHPASDAGKAAPPPARTPSKHKTPTAAKPAAAKPATAKPAAPLSHISTRQQPPVPEKADAQLSDPLEQARDALNYGHSEQARDLLLKLAAQKPLNATAAALLGQAFANLGAWDDAETWCDTAIHRNRLTIDAYYTLGLIHQHRGSVDQAIEAMKKVVYIDRKHILGHYMLADLYRKSGQMAQALKSLDNVRSLMDGLSPESVIPGSKGITVSHLQEAVTLQLQRWSA